MNWFANLINAIVVLVVLSPSAIALFFLIRRKRRQDVLRKESYDAALLAYSIGAVISPGLAVAYFVYISLTCSGGGCGSGVWMILTLPVTYILWFIGLSHAEKAFGSARLKKKNQVPRKS